MRSILLIAGMLLYALYPPGLAAVRTPTGAWEVVY
jgi:hypothetical protein